MSIESRLAKLEAVSDLNCPGVYKIETYRVRKGCEANLPARDDRCLACGQIHPPSSDGREQPVRRIIITWPAGEDDEYFGPEGWRCEPGWRPENEEEIAPCPER
jgi:hypothetical protein